MRKIFTSTAELSGDEEEGPLDDSKVVYEITSFGVDFLVDGLIRRLDDGDIYRPSFQRNFVWTVPQASRFIESILLGLPIPGIFLYREEDTQKQLIIDGLQRLTTIQSFSDGHLPNSDKRFRLKNVKERFEGRSIDDLEPQDKRRFQDASIHATIIQQKSPKDDNSAVFHIFDRLNSGGTPLQAQEMRAAIYHGPFQDLLEKLNEVESWRSIFGPESKRGKDQELILRFLALHYSWQKYNEPMKRFLNDFMDENRNSGNAKLRKFEAVFSDTCNKAVDYLGEKPFRPVRTLNVAVFDACMVALSQTENDDRKAILKKYNQLLENESFKAATSKSTASESNVTTRIQLAKEYLG